MFGANIQGNFRKKQISADSRSSGDMCLFVNGGNDAFGQGGRINVVQF